MRWLRRLHYWLRFRGNDAALREELETHRSLIQERLERDGVSPVDARAQATRAMGHATHMREDARGVWLPVALEAIGKDWGYAWRGLTRAPAFAVVAALSLA